MIVRVASVTCFALLLCQPAFADEPSYTRHRHRSYSAAPHVVELVAPPFSGRFVINGFRYDGVAPACLRWVPGQPVRLVSAGGSAIARAPRFTTCPRAPLARHCVGAARGGEGRLAESFRATWNAARVSFVRC